MADTYSEEMAVRICERMVGGDSLLKVCQTDGFPSIATVYRWRAAHPEFDHLLHRASQDQTDTFAMQMIDISNETVTSMPEAARQRERIHTLMWICARQRPKKWGDKLQVGGAEDLPPLQSPESQLDAIRRLAFLLRKAEGQIEDARAAEGPKPLQLAFTPSTPRDPESLRPELLLSPMMDSARRGAFTVEQPYVLTTEERLAAIAAQKRTEEEARLRRRHQELEELAQYGGAAEQGRDTYRTPAVYGSGRSPLSHRGR